jgi:hypothetical protein
MNLPRRVEPEWLDELPADNARAIHSRRDLKRLNALMLQTAIMSRLLAKYRGNTPPRRIVELGAGDGTFMLSVARRMAVRWPGIALILVDRQNIVTDATRRALRALHWNTEIVSADVFDFLEREPTGEADIVTANLFLHHFSPGELGRLLTGAARLAPLFVACEPRRTSPSLIASRLLLAIGCNDVTRHDAVVSVRAGFCDSELSALWPRDGRWELHEHAAIPFTHCFVARRSG